MDDFLEIVPIVAIESPCINVCVIDRASQRCTGCARTLDEIARWGSESAAWRAGVMAELSKRQSRVS